jgi:organic radical activating enzyme
MTVRDIVAACDRDIVILTGGEPCIHDLAPLVRKLHERGIPHYVCLETNGTLPTPETVDFVVCSPKPDNYAIHSDCRYNELKYVVDENFDVAVLPDEVKDSLGLVWLQPEGYNMEASMKQALKLVMEYPYLRLGMQLHKLYKLK